MSRDSEGQVPCWQQVRFSSLAGAEEIDAVLAKISTSFLIVPSLGTTNRVRLGFLGRQRRLPHHESSPPFGVGEVSGGSPGVGENRSAQKNSKKMGRTRNGSRLDDDSIVRARCPRPVSQFLSVNPAGPLFSLLPLTVTRVAPFRFPPPRHLPPPSPEYADKPHVYVDPGWCRWCPGQSAALLHFPTAGPSPVLL